jgi:hypothetical protein
MPKIHVAGDSFVGVCSALSMVANLGSNWMGCGAAMDDVAIFAAWFFCAIVIEFQKK